MLSESFSLRLSIDSSRSLFIQRDTSLLKFRSQVVHFFQLAFQAPVFDFLSILLSASSIHFDVHLSYFVSKACHHRIIFLALLLQTTIGSIHIADFVIQLCNSMFHVAQLISLMLIVAFNMSQSLHLNFNIVELASPAVIVIFRSIRLQELLTEHFNLIFRPVRPLLLHLCSVIRRTLISLSHVDHLLIMSSLLCRLQLQSTPLLLKVSLNAISLFSQPLCVPVLCLLPIELFLSLEPFILLLQSVLHLFFYGLLSSNCLLLHSSLHLIELALKIFFFRHDVRVVTIVCDSLIVIELTFHVIGE